MTWGITPQEAAQFGDAILLGIAVCMVGLGFLFLLLYSRLSTSVKILYPLLFIGAIIVILRVAGGLGGDAGAGILH